jgi:hypothetical protein
VASDRTGFVGGLLRALSGSAHQHGAQRERHRRAASSSAFGEGCPSDSWDVSGLEESEADDTCASTAAEEPRQALRGTRPRGAGRSFDSAARRHAGGSRRGAAPGAEHESTSAADGGDTEGSSSWPGGPMTSSNPAPAIRSPFSNHSQYRLAGLRVRAAAGSAAAGQLPGGGAFLHARLEQRSPTTETEGYDRAADTETGPTEAADVSASEQEAAAGEPVPACTADAPADDAAEPAAAAPRSWLLRPWAGVKRGMRRRASNA